MSVMNDT